MCKVQSLDLPRKMASQPPPFGETFTERAKRKFSNEPLVPIGTALTVFCFLYVKTCFCCTNNHMWQQSLLTQTTSFRIQQSHTITNTGSGGLNAMNNGDKLKANRLMRGRVAAQGFTIAVVLASAFGLFRGFGFGASAGAGGTMVGGDTTPPSSSSFSSSSSSSSSGSAAAAGGASAPSKN